jgi:cytochrome c peroxidase
MPSDRGAFKTPTLLDISKSAPYFHDGSVATLEEAVRLMANGGVANKYLDTANLQKRDLSDADIKDIVEFLNALTETTTLRQPQIPQ